MSNIKKIIAVVLALVMAISVATVAFAAEGDAYSVTVTADKTELQAGESATVTVKVTANFNVSAMSIPVFFDNTKVTASAGATTLEHATIVTETSPDVDKYFEGVDHTKDDYGVRAVVYIAPYGAEISSYTNATVMTFTVTANDDATGAVVLECISTSVKTSSNPSGALYIAKNSSGNATVDSLPEVIDEADITGATTTINIASAGGDPVLTGINGGVVDDQNSYVYGVPAGTTDFTAYFTVENGTFEVDQSVKSGTGAVLTVKTSSGDVYATYTLIIFGDVNGDNQIKLADYAVIKTAALGANIADPVQAFAADVNGDGQIKLADYAVVKTAALGGTITTNPFAS